MAASSATQSLKQVQKVQLRVMVNKEMNQVVYAKAGKDFVDVLFSFLTLPLGTIARLVSKESNMQPVRVGSLSSLYKSVADFDEEYLSSPSCKDMLLEPKNSMAPYCKKLKLNIDDTEPMQYFKCELWPSYCRERITKCTLSTFRNKKCPCGQVMEIEVSPDCSKLENGFVREAISFIISDDLYVMPNVFATIVRLCQKHGVNNSDTLQEKTVYITPKEVIDLLKLSFLSKTPLTDFIFNKKQFYGSSNPRDQSEIKIGKQESSDDGKQMHLKVMVKKTNGKIIFAEAEEDFADFVFSFLTFPLGLVVHMLEGFSSLGCLSNLYGSMKELSSDRYLIAQNLKDKLVKPKIAPLFDLTNHILPIGAAASLPVYYSDAYRGYYYGNCAVPKNMGGFYTADKCVQSSFVDPKSSSKSSTSGEFTKGPSTYMVTDDLVVTPMLYESAMSYLNRSKITLLDLEEKVVKIGLNEALCILKASMISGSATALTDGLSQFITTIKEPAKKRRIIKEEK